MILRTSLCENLKAIRMINKSVVKLKQTEKCIHISSVKCSKLYSDKHEWVEIIDGSKDSARVGITQYAADALGDVVFAQLPEKDQVLNTGDECGALESVKAASEIYSPISGAVESSNEDVENKPGLINSSAEDLAWLFQMKITNTDELKSLMSKEAYLKYLQSVTDDLE